MSDQGGAFNPPRIVGVDGSAYDDRCPNCRASRGKRVPSSGFGDPHDVCGSCGYEFEEFTCQD